MPAIQTLPPISQLPALITRNRFAHLTESETEKPHIIPPDALIKRLSGYSSLLMVYQPFTFQQLRISHLKPPSTLSCMDILELFTFAFPAQNVVPTLRGILDFFHHPNGVKIYSHPSPTTFHSYASAEETPYLLYEVAQQLLSHIKGLQYTPNAPEIAALALFLHHHRWNWAPYVLDALNLTPHTPPQMRLEDAIRVWRRLPKWEDPAPTPPPSETNAVSSEETRAYLAQLLGKKAENRAGQADFAGVITTIFQPPQPDTGPPVILLAEAGTGTGKTLGYLTPALLWSQKNHAPVWISTYTRYLQHQIFKELQKFLPHQEKAKRTIILRKGRENYLCLLNMEENLPSSLSAFSHESSTTRKGYGTLSASSSGGSEEGTGPSSRHIAYAHLARWATASQDGDILGGDLPGWFADLFPQLNLSALTDKRGECIHGACPHYQCCFIEHSIRKAKTADIVITNHALSMYQIAWAHLEKAQADSSPEQTSETLPTHYIFDEGHHLPEAADQAFSVALSGLEAAELRRWLLGAEGRNSRAKGLRRRFDNLIDAIPELADHLHSLSLATHKTLPESGWNKRIDQLFEDTLSEPDNSQLPFSSPPLPLTLVEQLLLVFRKHISLHSTAKKTSSAYASREADPFPLPAHSLPIIQNLQSGLREIASILKKLAAALKAHLEANPETLDKNMRLHIEGLLVSLQRHGIERLTAWDGILENLIAQNTRPSSETSETPNTISFLSLDYFSAIAPRAYNLGIYRHWTDPALPFSLNMAPLSKGIVITSATLRDQADTQTEESWHMAEKRLGACHFPFPAIRASLSSPFNYAEQTRTFIITDVQHNDIALLASAFRALFCASGGGGLGLFTAISRLQATYKLLVDPLQQQGITLFAQHVDGISNASLIDLFKADPHSCLLGTDAMRDGVDVPGESLRLVAFERIPWPRGTILHRERRIHLSEGNPSLYDEQSVRLKLRQAFGRLIRTQNDKGVFVLLDRRTPTRMLSAFPPGTNPQRVGLKDALEEIKKFLSPHLR